MAVYLELVSTPISNNNFDGGGPRRRAGANEARRPVRGLEIKENTFAMMKVILPDGTPVPLLNSGTKKAQSSDIGYDEMTTNFILQSATTARMEKHQIIETFGDAYVFFFGEHPQFIDYSAVVLNSNDFNWEAEFDANYDAYFRGTKLVELGARLYLYYDDTIVQGYMVQLQKQKTSNDPLHVNISFKVFVTGTSNVSQVGSINFPISEIAQAAFGQYSDLIGNYRGNAYDAESFFKIVSELYDPTRDLSKQPPWTMPAFSRLRGQIADNEDEYIKSYDYGEPPKLQDRSTPTVDDAANEVAQIPLDEVQNLMNDLVGQENADKPGFWKKLGNCFSSGPDGYGFDTKKGFGDLSTGDGFGFGNGPGSFNGKSLSPKEFFNKIKDGVKDAKKAANKAKKYLDEHDTGDIADDLYKEAKDALKKAPVTVNGKHTTVGKVYDSVKEDAETFYEDPGKYAYKKAKKAYNQSKGKGSQGGNKGNGKKNPNTSTTQSNPVYATVVVGLCLRSLPVD